MRTRRGVCYPKVKKNHTNEMKSSAKNRCRQYPEKKTQAMEIVTGRVASLVSCETTTKKRGRDLAKVVLPTQAVMPVVTTACRKRTKLMRPAGFGVGRDSCFVGEEGGKDFFDGLPDDLVACILGKLGASASCPADFINVLITCKRLNVLALHSMVLSKASPRTFAIRAKNWSESAHRFLKLCADAGNSDACYTLGMIRFYCLQNRGNGASLMARAAINSHAQALYSLSVIQFNGSGGSKNDKDLRAGVALCARAAFLGHVDALRELGHCLQDGYGVRQNITEGRRFLVQANARELAAVISANPTALSSSAAKSWVAHNYQQLISSQNRQNSQNQLNSQNQSESQTNRLAAVAAVSGCPLLSDFGCNIPAPDVHPVNKFLVDWFRGKKLDEGLRLCSHKGCGRPETRPHEFRRCSVCARVNYCSRACQALDWKLSHKGDCAPMERWMMDVDEEEGGGADGGDEDEEEEEEEVEMVAVDDDDEADVDHEES